MSLDRFKVAQAGSSGGYATALSEMRSGAKSSHWIWYIFPQLAVLGRSSTAKFYGIAGLSEARGYLEDAVLGERLMEITGVVAQKLREGIPVIRLMGSETDALKLSSCMTLFETVAKQAHAVKPDAGFARFAVQCGEIIRIIEPQGFPRCQVSSAAS